ncbi:MAG: hypothetical protein MRY32_08360 [Rickettsiales bacterium]|nr:hypothetical protein [Rickettsiales bacterium]
MNDETNTSGEDKYEPDNISRIIMLIYGTLETGGPFWCYVAVKPSQFDAFQEAETSGKLDLYNFDQFGEVVVSGEGDKPPKEVTQKVAEMYNTNPADFFKPIDPKAEINRKIDELKSQEQQDT